MIGAELPVPSMDDTPGLKALPFLLGVIAGSVDVIGFLALGGLFTAHITGNLVVLAAHLVTGVDASLAHMLSVPVFIAALAATRLAAAGLERAGIRILGPLLWAQFLLLIAFLVIGVAAGPGASPGAPLMIGAAMVGVCAMAVQNALVRIGLDGAPATAVLTTNLTLLTMDLGEIVLGTDAGHVAKARERARRTWPAIAGFMFGCALGAACEAVLGLHALVLPVTCALIALPAASLPARQALPR